jgi:putative cell wall-binding protein
VKHRLIKFRRVAVSCIAGVTALTGLSVLGLASAAYAAPASGSSIVATSAPNIVAAGTNQTAGNLTITLAKGSTWASGDTIAVTVKDSAGTANIFWDHNPTLTVTTGSGDTGLCSSGNFGCTVTGAGASSSTVTIALTGVGTSGTTSSASTLVLSDIGYTTSGSAGGAVQIAGEFDHPAGTGVFAFTTGAAASNASVVSPLVVTATAVTPVPTVAVGGSNQAASNWTIALSGYVGASGWSTGDTLALAVAPHGVNNCSGTYPAIATIAFHAVPTLGTPTLGTGQTASPTFTASLQPDVSECIGATGVNDELVLTFTNSGLITGTTTSPVSFTISGVAYDLSSYVPQGAVTVTGSSSVGDTTVTTGAAASNATVAAVTLTANSPAVTAPPNAVNQSISNIVITESAAGQVTGTVKATLTDSNTTTHTAIFDASDAPVVAATGGAVVGKVTGVGTDALSFTVTTPSTSAGTFTLSALTVDTPSTPTGPVTVSVTFGMAGSIGPVTAFTVASPATQIYGQVDIGTAVAELEAEFPYASGVCPSNGYANPATGPTWTRPVVLATEANYPDALAADYLAQSLGTGELLTWTASLPAETLNALRLEGINHVYVVGGPLAISTAVVSQLESTPSYTCGGGSEIVNTLGAVVDLQVTQIYGQTAYDTAADIAEYLGAPVVGTASFSGAYAGTNSSSGNGMYNDTSGTASSAPSTSTRLPTAILATGENYPDALSGSVLSYVKKFPLLLTTTDSLSSQAASAFAQLGIQQLIVLGGPLAVSNAVVTAVQALGISVLRIAGTDLTDTAVQLADFEVNTTTGGVGLGWNPNGSITVARGDFYTDGLTGAIVAATGDTACTGEDISSCSTAHPTPVLLTEDPNTVGTYLTAFLNQAGSSTGIDAASLSGAVIDHLIILGGPLAVSLTTISTMEGDL